MADDIARLGIRIDSDGVERGSAALDDLTKSAERAETAEEKLHSASQRTSKSIGDQHVSARQAALSVQQLASRTAEAARVDEHATQRIKAMVAASLERARAQKVAIDAASQATRPNVGGTGDVSKLSAGYQQLTRSFQESQRELYALNDALSRQAQSLDDIGERRAWVNDLYDRGLLSFDETEDAMKRLDQQTRQLGKAQDDNAKNVARLVRQYDPAGEALKRLAADELKLQQALRSGAITQDQYAKAMSGLTAARVSASAEAQRIALQARMATTATQENARSMNLAGLSAKQYAQAMRFLPAQITDVVTSLVSGQPAYLVAIQQGGQIKDSFGGVANTFKALGSILTPTRLLLGGLAGGAIVIAKAMFDAEKESAAFTKAIILSGNAAGITRSQLAGMAEEMDGIRGTQAAASASLAALAATGKVAGRNLQEFALVAQSLERNAGVAIEETAKTFAELGRDPVSASRKLNEQYNYLTANVYAQIRALADEGKIREAGEVAQKAYAAAQDQRTRQVEANLGSLQRAARATGGFFKEMWDGILDIGREGSLDKQIASIEARIADLQRTPLSGVGVSIDSTAALRRQRDALLERRRLEEESAAADARRIAADEAAIKRRDLIEKVVQARWSTAIQLRDEHFAASQSQVQRVLSETLSEYNAYERGLEAARAAGLIDERAYYGEKKRLIEQDMFTRIKALNEENALIRKQAEDIKRIAASDIERLGDDPEKEAERIRLRADADRKLIANQEKIADNEQKIREIRRDAASEAKELANTQAVAVFGVLQQLRDETEEYRAQTAAIRNTAEAVDELRRKRGLERAGASVTPEIEDARVERNTARDDLSIAALQDELDLLQMTNRERQVEQALRGLSRDATVDQRLEVQRLTEELTRTELFNSQFEAIKQEFDAFSEDYLLSYNDMYDEIDRRQKANLISEQEAANARILIAKSEAASRIGAAQTLFGGLENLMGSKSKTLFRIGKAAAIANATVSAAQAISNAYATQPWYLGLAQGISAAALLAVQIQNIKNTEMRGFMRGGYTGDVPRDQVAGLVHGREYVLNSEATSRIGRGTLDRLSTGAAQVIDRTAANASTFQMPKITVIDKSSGAKTWRQEMGPDEVRIIAEDVALKTVQKRAPSLIAAEISNPNSTVSKSLNRNTLASRKRN